MRRLVTAVFVSFGAVWCCAQQPPAPARADQFLTELERSLRTTPDLRPHLADSVAITASILRKEPKTAKAWQLEPAFANTLSDIELRDYVLMRANLALTCGLDVMRRTPLATITQRQVDALNPRQVYAPAAAEAGLSADCVTINDRPQQRAWVATRPQLNTWLRLPFSPLSAKETFAARNAQQPDSLLDSNLAYLRRVAGGAHVDNEIAAAAGLPRDAVFVGSVINLMAYVRLDRPSPQLLLVTPLSW